MKEEKKETQNPTQIVLNEKSMEVLVAKFIPTSQYFERSFEMLRNQIEKQGKEFERFEKYVDKRFEQVDKRFEQIDKRIGKLSQNIQDLTLEIKELAKSQEVTLREYIIERDRHYDQKFATNRTYFLTVMGLMITIFLKMAGIIDIPKLNQSNNHQYHQKMNLNE